MNKGLNTYLTLMILMSSKILLTTHNPKNYFSADSRYHFEKALENHATIYHCGKDWGDKTWNHEQPLQQYCDEENIQPDWVLQWQKVKGAKNYGNLIDMHRNVNFKINRINKRKYDLLFFTYPECPYGYMESHRGVLEKINPNHWMDNVNCPVEVAPHSVESSIYYPKKNGEDYLYDVTFLGDYGLPFYPLRVKMVEQLPKLAEKHGFKLLCKTRAPGKLATLKIDEIVKNNPNLESKHLAGGVYAEALRRSRVFVFGTSILGYAMKKWFEAGASKCCILADSPSDADALGLKPWENYIPVTEVNWVERLEYIIGEPELAAKIGENWYNTVMEKHINDVRAKEFVETLERYQ